MKNLIVMGKQRTKRDIIRELWGRRSSGEIAELLGWQRRSVVSEANMMGLTRGKEQMRRIMRRRNMDDATFERLERHYDDIMRMLGTHSCKEVAEHFDVPHKRVLMIYNRNHIERTEEVKARLRRRCGEWMCDKERVRLAAEKRMRHKRSDELRMASGLKPEYRFQHAQMPKKAYKTKSRLAMVYGYFHCEDDVTVLLYDETTRRTMRKGEQYYTDTYGIRFYEAED